MDQPLHPADETDSPRQCNFFVYIIMDDQIGYFFCTISQLAMIITVFRQKKKNANTKIQQLKASVQWKGEKTKLNFVLFLGVDPNTVYIKTQVVDSYTVHIKCKETKAIPTTGLIIK